MSMLILFFNKKLEVYYPYILIEANQYFTKKENISDKPCDLLCPICLQLFVKPVTTICGHSFCIRCLDQTLLFKTDCPSCRNYLRGTKSVMCQSLNALILRLIQKYPQDEQEFYHQLYKQTLQWLQSRNPDPEQLKPGDKLDVKDTEFIWCQAIVRELYYKHGKVCSVLVHYVGWNSVYDEIIDVESERLARVGFYTARRELPHYRGYDNGQQQQRMYGYVVNSQVQALNGEMLNMNLNMNNLNMNMQNINNDIMLDPHIDSNMLFALNNNLLGFQFGNNLNQVPNSMNLNLYNGNLYNNFYNQYQVERGGFSDFAVIEEREDEEVEADGDGHAEDQEAEGSQYNGLDLDCQYGHYDQNQSALDPQLWQDDQLDNNGEIVDLITGQHHQITWTNNQMILHSNNDVHYSSEQQGQQEEKQQQQQGQLGIAKQARLAELQHFQQKIQDTIEQSLHYIKQLQGRQYEWKQPGEKAYKKNRNYGKEHNDCGKKYQKKMNNFSQVYQSSYEPKDQGQDLSEGQDWNKIQCVYQSKSQKQHQQKSQDQFEQFFKYNKRLTNDGQYFSNDQLNSCIQQNLTQKQIHNCKVGGYYQLNQQNQQEQPQQYHSRQQKKQEMQDGVQYKYSSSDMQKLQNLEMQAEKFGIDLLGLLEQHGLPINQEQSNKSLQTPQPAYNSEPCISVLKQSKFQKNPEQVFSSSSSPEKAEIEKIHTVKSVDMENRQKQMQIAEDNKQQLKQQQNQKQKQNQNQNQKNCFGGIYKVQIS